MITSSTETPLTDREDMSVKLLIMKKTICWGPQVRQGLDSSRQTEKLNNTVIHKTVLRRDMAF